jgi:hypothetical protein
MKRFFFLLTLTGTLLLSSLRPCMAYPYGGGGWGGGGYHGGWGGCYRGGWYGTGIPNGLGWTLFGLGAAAVAAPVAYAVAAPPVYAAPYPSVGDYNPPRTVVRERKSATQSELLAKVQTKLSALGYYRGNIDGSFGPQTELAVTKFQGENGLPMTGRIDLKTLSSLGITL